MHGSLKCAFAVLLLCSSGALAQDLDAELKQAIQLSDDGEWEAATQALNHLLETGQLAKSQQTQARRFLAESYVFLKQSDQAVAVYQQILQDDPSFNMRSLGEDPDDRLVRHLGQAALLRAEDLLREREIQYSNISRKSVFLRSTLLPGWGQRYQGYRWRGHVMLGLVASSVAYAVVSEQAFRKARDHYDQAPTTTTKEEFATFYDDYDTKAGLADLALGVVGAIWAANVLDALFQRPALARAQHALELAPTPGLAGVQVAFVAKF